MCQNKLLEILHKMLAIEGGIGWRTTVWRIPILAYRALAPSGKKFIQEASKEDLRITAEGIQKEV